MRIANTELFQGWFTFQDTCEKATFYAVEMGICGEPVSVIGITLWLTTALVVFFILLVLLVNKETRNFLTAASLFVGLVWFAIAANSGKIPQWVMQIIGGVFVVGMLGFAGALAIIWAKVNRKAAVVVITIYLMLVISLYFGFDRNIESSWGEMVGLPVLLLAICGIISLPFIMAGKAVFRFWRQRHGSRQDS